MKKYNPITFLFRQERKILYLVLAPTIITLVLLLFLIKPNEIVLRIFIPILTSYLFFILTVEIPTYQKYKQHLILIQIPALNIVTSIFNLLLTVIIGGSTSAAFTSDFMLNLTFPHPNEFEEIFKGTSIKIRSQGLLTLIESSVNNSLSIMQEINNDFLGKDELLALSNIKRDLLLIKKFSAVPDKDENSIIVINIENATIKNLYAYAQKFWMLFVRIIEPNIPSKPALDKFFINTYPIT